MSIAITKSTFDEVLKSNQTVLVHFWAPWCSPCKLVSLVLDEIAKDRPDIVIGNVNADVQKELVARFDIKGLPVVIVFKNGTAIGKYLHTVNKDMILQQLEVEQCTAFDTPSCEAPKECHVADWNGIQSVRRMEPDDLNLTEEFGPDFLTMWIEDAKLAEICEAHNLNEIAKDDIVSCGFDLEGTRLDTPPCGRDFVDWFIAFVKDVRIADNSFHDDIETNRKTITDGLVYSAIVYSHNNPEDYYDNCYWEETRENGNITLKGFDTASWNLVWETHNLDEIAELKKDGSSNISMYNPQEYPFWLFLQEGWMSPSAGDQFAREMVQRYGVRQV